jgi:hypothetical protein
MAVLDVSVVAGADDGRSNDAGVFASGIEFLTAGQVGAAIYDSFMRFDGVTIPQGSTIVAAYLEVVAVGGGGFPSCLTNIYADDSDDAVAPTTQALHAGKVRTTAFVAWDAPTAWAAASTYQSPDIATVIQEIVSRAGWVSGNALQILWDDDSSPEGSYLQAAPWDDLTYAAPLLHIEWTVITTPNVVGLSAADAQTAIEAEGLVYAEGVNTPVTAPTQAGLVQTQTPAAGSYVATGTTISVSLGVYQTPPVVVPSYMGVEYRGVRMGVGESVLVKELVGWEDQSASPGSPKLAAEHGGAPIRKLAEPLTITAVLALVDPTARDTLLAALSVAGSEEVEHQLIMRNDPFGAPDRFRWARVDDRRMPRDRLAHAGVSGVKVRWEARDPRLYALTEESIVLAPYNAGAGGIDFPWDFPLDFTAPVGTEKVATVTDGDNPAYPVIRFINQGATTCTQVTLFQRTSLQVLDIVTPIAAGETLTVDLLALIRRTGGLTVYLGGVSRYGAWTPPRDPLHLDPGDNRLRFTAEPAGVDMICGISWRPTWL